MMKCNQNTEPPQHFKIMNYMPQNHKIGSKNHEIIKTNSCEDFLITF